MSVDLPMDRRTFLSLEWRLDEPNPLIQPPRPSPVIADPTVLTPDRSPDGRWHLFAHSLLGLHHYVGDDGTGWERRATIATAAMRPHIVRDGGTYVLAYEKCRPVPPVGPFRWASRLVACTSSDLVTWSDEQTILEPTLSWHREPGRGSAVSNPCLVRVGDRWSLYYSAGLVPLHDCGFNEPRYIGVAEGPSPTGPFTPQADPMLGPEAADEFANLGAGAIKVYRATDGWIGLQNGIYFDAKDRTRSAVRPLVGTDGVSWAIQPPILRPGGDSWMRSHVYAVDLALDGDRLHLYFNARNGWHWTKGREAIGRATADIP